MTTRHERPAAFDGPGAGRPSTTKKRDAASADAGPRERPANTPAAADGFCLLDRNGRFLEANETYCRMSGYTTQELLVMRLSDLEAGGTSEDAARRIQEIMRTGSARFESRQRRKDGGLLDLDISASVQPTNGGHVSCLLRDITGRKDIAHTLGRRIHQLEAVRAVA